ncbi:helix-turn-helix transcriptional regulator [Burkholderia ubonensis]|uniref:response regulator transcription factor n=1 Tax=Burkholderia ubonensis TaxID=101571 RepID=UPI00075B4EE5|nr:response regulator transcription factor [Burkholderia ubonensis]AOI73801.1 helix-turn-helix transcriptional regulator [Burkholderia ubonensis]KUZ17046.1 helix-turn-helix transcriptional regulator [Burkholderia ubonensis]KUZ20869.1 helix-turn-helix transcriptional regulator [Burkholderia ubonensis]KUZ26319.1 helix-turn-helix transcriptional regulator [Burkholderia ubonensis]KUZ44383.1 helix-turn-helix transcriptional regulator [Burkholderia ubonensis]
MGKFNVRIVFAYDWPLTLAGMEHIASSASAIDLVGVYQRASDMVASIGDVVCDIALIDYAMRSDGQMEMLKLLDFVRVARPHVGIVVLVTHESPVIIRSILARGALSVVSKLDDVGHIVTAIHSSYGGGSYLSPTVKRTLASADDDGDGAPKLSQREIEVIRLYLSGVSIKAIAERLNKGKQTVSAQKISAMKKLGAKNDIELVRRAATLGLRHDANANANANASVAAPA